MRPSPMPAVDTLAHPLAYTRRQLLQAAAIAKQAGSILGGDQGYVHGELGNGFVLGLDDDRGVLVLAEAPGRVPA